MGAPGVEVKSDCIVNKERYECENEVEDAEDVHWDHVPVFVLESGREVVQTEESCVVDSTEFEGVKKCDSLNKT